MRKAVITALGALVLAATVGCSNSGSSSPSSSAPPSPTATGKAEWSYSGDTGPANWANLSTDYAACGTGKVQSPIDIVTPTQTTTPDPTIDYPGTNGTVVDTGHTTNLTAEGENTMTIAGKPYVIEHMHFHVPSETTIGGKQFAAEFHIVHQAADGSNAVLAILASEGAESPAWNTYINAMDIGTGDDDAERIAVKWSSLPPPVKSVIQFQGSLTTPPCTEGLSWNVIPTPITLSVGQIAKMSNVYRDNVRPVQPSNGRQVVQDVK